jgi:hypothetical protein
MAHPKGSALRAAYQAFTERSNDRRVREGACGCCGRWTTVRADDDEAPDVQNEFETFGELECPECADDRMHELDHIARAASEAEHARIVRDVPLAGTYRGIAHERAYRAWCDRRSLAPLEPQPCSAPPSPEDPVKVGSGA